MENDTQQPSLEQQLAEAEERGYHRGLNEQIARKMEEPAVWEDSAATPAPAPRPDTGYHILQGLRHSIWD